jgi:hypothetical protein
MNAALQQVGSEHEDKAKEEKAEKSVRNTIVETT